MKKDIGKIFPGLVSVVLLFGISSFCGEVYAQRKVPIASQSNETISGFLASVAFCRHACHFDHDGDGITDMVVYPLKTTVPDLTTKYVTLAQAVRRCELVLREHPRNYGPRRGLRIGSGARNTGPNILAQYMGSSRGYYQGGQMLRGGGQGRGFRGGGVLGGGYQGGPYIGGGGYSGGYRGGRYGPSGYSGYGRGGGYRDRYHLRSQSAGTMPEFEMDVFCFEKGRIITESMKAGSSEYFSYSGLASPLVRKALILATNQRNIDRIIAAELHELGVASSTGAFNHVFDSQGIAAIINYYVYHTQNILDDNADVSGMIIARGDGEILCADIYSSPDLFKQMFGQLMQSGALGVCKRTTRRGYREMNVDKFLNDIKQAQGWKRATSQTYKHISSALVSETILDGAKCVHLEAYSR